MNFSRKGTQRSQRNDLKNRFRFFPYYSGNISVLPSADPEGIGITQPKVARNELPWVSIQSTINPERVGANPSSWSHLFNPYRVAPLRTSTQGRRCYANPGLTDHNPVGVARGFTLLEMMITLAIFILLAAAVFGIMTGVLQGTSSLQDNQNRRDQIAALNAFLKNKLGEMPAASTLSSYQRGDGEGLVQNGIIFGTANQATAIDATTQANGYYALRLTTFTTEAGPGQPQDARQVLQQAVTTNDPTLAWTSLIGDIKTLDWKFQGLNSDWVTIWAGSSKPNLVEYSMQTAGDLQPTTMDFWIPNIEAASISIAPQVSGMTGTASPPSPRPAPRSP